MAVTERWLAAWVARQGPFVYHLCDAARMASILDRGLLPWDQGPGPQNGGEYEPRPTHVYAMTLQEHLRTGGLPMHLISIDLRGIDAHRINPDEDCFWSKVLIRGPMQAWRWGLSSPTQTVRAYDFPGDVRRFPTEQRPYRSFGHWAHAENVGENPELTQRAVEQFQTLAIRGRVEPHLLAAWTADSRDGELRSAAPCIAATAATASAAAAA